MYKRSIGAIAATLLISCVSATSVAAEPDYQALGASIVEQEKQLVFDTFTNEDALNLGMLMVNRARQENKAIVVDITRNGQQLFHVALPGTGVENDYWVKRKNEVTNRSYRSSLAMWYWEKEGWMEGAFDMKYLEMWGLDSGSAMNLGGAFPLNVKDVGVIGTITVSGLPHEEDHAFAVASIKQYLAQR